MNFQQLRALCEVVDRLYNISTAARALNASQPAVSKQIANFEEELQTEIFVRKKGRLVGLSPAGERINRAAQVILGAISEIRSICEQEEVAHGQITIAASRVRARNFLPTIVRAFREAHPHVEVNITHAALDDMLNLLIHNEITLGITIEEVSPDPAIVALPFEEIERIILAPRGHPITEEKTITLKKLAAFPLVLYDKSFLIRRDIDTSLADIGIVPEIVISASDADVIKGYVSHGLGIAVAARSTFDPELDTGLCAIPAGHLFRPSVAKVLVSRNHFLKDFEFDFITKCAPVWTKTRVRQAISRAQGFS